MEKGKWIFLTKKLPTEVAPPAMSIHYAVPWAMQTSSFSKSATVRLNRVRTLLKDSGLVNKDELDNMDKFKLVSFILSNDDVYDFIDTRDSDLLDFSDITSHTESELRRFEWSCTNQIRRRKHPCLSRRIFRSFA